MARSQYGPLRDAELEEISSILGASFAFDPAEAPVWMERAGHANIRVLRIDGRPAATLMRIPMGQYFGGRSVPMVGIAAVGTAPWARGRGVATDLIGRTLREMAREGVALSALYPATQSVYRRAGFEHGGARFEIRVAARELGDGDRTLAVRAVEPRDWPAIRRIYAERARRRDGFLDRGPYVWGRVHDQIGLQVQGLVVESARGEVDGYVFFSSRRYEGVHYDVFVRCMAARTDRARRRLATLLGDHRSLGRDVVWFGPAADARTTSLREQRYRVRLDMHWMLRTVELEAALSARGFPRHVRGELHFEVSDGLIRANRGLFRLEVDGGRARVRRGGRGSLRLHVRALAALYSGFASPWELEARGALSGSARTLELAAALFAGTAPSMPDMF